MSKTILVMDDEPRDFLRNESLSIATLIAALNVIIPPNLRCEEPF
jgi:hypothetical protein